VHLVNTERIFYPSW